MPISRFRTSVGVVMLASLGFPPTVGGHGAPAQESLPGNVVEIVAGDYFIRGPDAIPAGLTTFVLRLQSGHHALFVVKLDDGRTVTDFVQSYAARTPRPWATLLGGPGFASRERPANATMVLEPGNYVLADVMNEEKYDGTGHLSKGMYRPLTVGPPTSSSSEPAADLVVRMTDSRFELSRPLTAGVHVIRVENAGTREHEFKVWRVLPGRAAAGLRRGASLREATEEWGGITGFPAGRHVTTTLEFLPGEYVFTSCCGGEQPPLTSFAVPAPPANQSSEAIPPLVRAIWTEDLDEVGKLLDAGADPESKTTNAGGRPAWMWAIVAGDRRATGLLLAKVDKVDRANALLYAANRDDVALARALLDRGMPVDARGIDGSTALQIAAASGHVETMQLLLERGASVNAADDFGDTALMAAVRAGSRNAVDRLLAAGADVNARGRDGRHALAWAARAGRGEVIDAVRARGAAGDASRPASTPVMLRAAVERSLPLIQKGTATWSTRQQCGACHHHPLMLRAVAIAKRHGFAIDAGLLQAEVDRFESPPRNRLGSQRGAAMKAALGSEAGILAWSLRNGGDTSFGNPWFLASFADAGVRSLAIETETLLIGRMQLGDGRWRAAPARVPIVSSDFTSTASAVKVLQAFGAASDAGEIGDRIARATAWLRRSTPVTTDDAAFRLFGLHWAKSDRASIADAVARLRQEQNADGGWAQLRGLNSDAYATGLVLVALHEAGGVGTGDPVYQRGVRYLLDTVEPDGSWLVHKRAVPLNEYFESGFPHGKFQFISYAGTCWATMALIYATPGVG
jgi:N-acyl-D-amino-acid deacylase